MDDVPSILGGIVRHILTTTGGILVSSGYLDSSQTSVFVGGGMVIAGVAWSWWQKKGQALVIADLKAIVGRRRQ